MDVELIVGFDANQAPPPNTLRIRVAEGVNESEGDGDLIKNEDVNELADATKKPPPPCQKFIRRVIGATRRMPCRNV